MVNCQWYYNKGEAIGNNNCQWYYNKGEAIGNNSNSAMKWHAEAHSVQKSPTSSQNFVWPTD